MQVRNKIVYDTRDLVAHCHGQNGPLKSRTYRNVLFVRINDINDWNFSILQYQNTEKSDCV